MKTIGYERAGEILQGIREARRKDLLRLAEQKRQRLVLEIGQMNQGDHNHHVVVFFAIYLRQLGFWTKYAETSS